MVIGISLVFFYLGKLLFSGFFPESKDNILLGQLTENGRCGGLMVSDLDSGASGPGSSPGRGHYVVFLGKTLSPPRCINRYWRI